MTIRMEFTSIDQQVKDLDSEAAKVKELLEEEADLLLDLSNSWSGSAADSFATMYVNFQKEAAEEAVALNKLCAAVHDAYDNMGLIERKVTEKFGTSGGS